MNREKFNDVFLSVSDFFSLLSNTDRIKIIGLLLKKEMDVNDIHKAINISQSRVSQHLRLLKTKSLVEERREGKHIYYHVKDPRVSRIIESVIQFQMIGFTSDKETISLMNELFIMWHI